MELSLYPHNQAAYENAKFVLENQNRTAIIHATGTGKSLIIAKFILENPNAKCLFIAPTGFIFSELKKHIKGAKNVDFRTFQFFLFNEIASYIGYDFIFIDEFHRAGAEQWNKIIDNLFFINPSAKIIGTTATHIRHLDNERNIAEEVFNGSIASYLSLGNAIEEGILKKPIYVSALYNIIEIIDSTEKTLKSNNRNKDLDSLRSKRVIWEKSNGIDFITKKYLTLKRKKILVFCKSVEHIYFVKNLIEPILVDFYNNNIEFKTIFSSLGTKKTSNIYKSFEKSIVPQVLFTVDMLNEGIHVKGVDTIMMFRDTISPNIFYQQIGRSFSIGQKLQPLIFDFVNNFNITNSLSKIQDNFFENFNKLNTDIISNERNLIIDFYDEILNFSNFINSFSVKSWDQEFDDLKIFINNNNRLPIKKESEWLYKQTCIYYNNKLEDSKINKFNELNQDFFLNLDYNNWNLNFAKYKKCFLDGKIHSNLYAWRKTQKYLYNLDLLSKRRIEILLSLDSDFFKSELNIWNEKLEETKCFIKTNKRIPTYKENEWFLRQLSKFDNGELKSERKIQIGDIVNEMNLLKVGRIRRSWIERYNKINDFYLLFNRLPNYKEPYGNWISDQRYKKRQNKLSPQEVLLLLKIDENFFN